MPHVFGRRTAPEWGRYLALAQVLLWLAPDISLGAVGEASKMPGANQGLTWASAGQSDHPEGQKTAHGHQLGLLLWVTTLPMHGWSGLACAAPPRRITEPTPLALASSPPASPVERRASLLESASPMAGGRERERERERLCERETLGTSCSTPGSFPQRTARTPGTAVGLQSQGSAQLFAQSCPEGGGCTSTHARRCKSVSENAEGGDCSCSLNPGP